MSLQKPKAVCVVSGNTLQQTGKFIYFGVEFTRDRKKEKETDEWIGRAKEVLHKLISLLSQHVSFQTPRKCKGQRLDFCDEFKA